jgi:hypothetical protein
MITFKCLYPCLITYIVNLPGLSFLLRLDIEILTLNLTACAIECALAKRLIKSNLIPRLLRTQFNWGGIVWDRD